ncbi:MAG: rRNA maturation RNase YbeY [Candidatus Magasanikbacteria bacterium]|jgi:probable rRNA maturation factor|nr:rRNA maturation RNase YbeY [Candidatus Magasanikbacteria bacterium]MBT5262323.1 rRNA maturation RNase YbeY [Candidatus Magasanikbacteria bacterium]MBT5820414.1 rRNA maturation RNase YbeY [Candidatus Magasanikbacteria bacterium]MBT6294299.1 rRNA maturation RNase YbeY [Candidatus Magasanikbacteria bacterium]
MMECNVYKTVKTISLSQKTVELVVFSVLTYCKKQGVVSVHFIGDQKMQRLNSMYRGKDNTTDVLSFSMQEGEKFPGEQDDLGDIFISVPQIHKQAKAYAVTYRSEIIRMMIHGTLHLLGYDHIKKKEAEEMFRIQEELHRRFI